MKIGSIVRNGNTRGEVLDLNRAFDPPLAFVEWETKDKSGGRKKGWVPISALHLIEKKPNVTRPSDFE